MLSRVLYGPDRIVFENGFPLTARLAWGRTRRSDPSIGEWLADGRRFEEHGNGAVLFAPKLLQRATEAQVPHIGKLRGVMRWRLASNNYTASSLAAAVTALTSASQRVSVAGGWSDLARGRLPMSAVHLDFFVAAVNPFHRRNVEDALRPLGWSNVGDVWQRRIREGEGGSKLVRMRVGPSLIKSASSRFEDDIFPQRGGLHHVEGIPLALVLAQHAFDSAFIGEKGPCLDRLAEFLPDQEQVESLVEYAGRIGNLLAVRRTLTLIDGLCGSRVSALLRRLGGMIS